MASKKPPDRKLTSLETLISVFAAAESDLALRIRRALSGGTGRMISRSIVLAAVLLCAFAITLPSSGIADEERDRDERGAVRTERDADDGVDWEVVKTTPPEEWSDELKAQIVAAGHDLEAIARRVRAYRQEEATRLHRETDVDLEALGRRIRAAIERGGAR